MPDYSSGNFSPMLKQYFDVKAERDGVILLMRVGDFYEAYGDDAELAARELDITLTGREDKTAGCRIPMAGVPYHAVERYVARLISRGYKVALCDQVEDPKLAKGLVKREVTRVLTPGTVVEDALLDARRNNYLVAAITAERGPSGVGVVDVSTGEFLTTELGHDAGIERMIDEVARLHPAEVLVLYDIGDDIVEQLRSATGALITTHRSSDQRRAPRQQLLDHFGTQSLRGFGCEQYTTGIEAAALLLDYIRHTHQSALANIRSLATYSTESFMMLDVATRRNLELTQSQLDGARTKSLIYILDKTVTPLGGRLLRKWLDQPLLDLEEIRSRQDTVSAFAAESIFRADTRDALRGVCDLERLTTRSSTGAANARDLVAIRQSIDNLLKLRKLLDGVSGDGPLSDAVASLAQIPEDLRETLSRALVDDPPITLRDGGLIKAGYDDELDQLRDLRSGGKDMLARMEETERERSGIKPLKVGYNQVFGYYIEVPRQFADSVPEDYIRKQTTANTERYITPALKEYEAQVLGAEERMVEREYRLFSELRQFVADRYNIVLLKLARTVAALDVGACLAEVAVQYRFVRPEVTDGDELRLVNSRHPVVELLQTGTLFVPNNVDLDAHHRRLQIITGPNASGKSTFLRQVALCTLLAQIGSFVPADSAQIGVVDRIFTRVGAQDDLASGQSTFMVEMNETANILNNATNRSLVILDEVGRGTSTYDGLALAWAIAEYLHAIEAKTLFATHYHQLNELEKTLPGAANFRIAVKEQGDQIVWLRKIMPGGTDKSYGVQVARLAGIPDSVIRRATDVLKNLEAREKAGGAGKSSHHVTATTKRLQLTLFESEPHPVLSEIEALDLSVMSPIEALTKLYDLQRRLHETK
jgi:DNA mismatch repair protein MutS